MAGTAAAKKTRVVTYVRMSTQKQDASPERQRRELKKYCRDKGYIIDCEYCDLGISGDDSKKRKQFLEMMQLAAAGKIKHILAFDTARLSRADALEAGKHFAPVRDAGCIIETVSDGILDYDEFGSRLTLMMKQEMDHEKIVTNSRDVVSGQTAAAVQGIGYPGGSTPLGYKRVANRQKSLNGKRNKWTAELVVDETTAPLIRRIFNDYNKPDGSIRQVVAELNKEGIPAPKGGIWRQMTLQVILRNRLYRGDYVWGKRATGKYHTRAGETGGVKRRKKSDKKTKQTPIVHEGIMPRIIDEDTWQTTQRLLEERKKNYTPPKTRKPFSGLVYCKDCGQKMRSDKDGYRCSSAGSDQKKRCPSYNIPNKLLLEGVAEGLNQALSRTEKPALVKALREAAGSEQVKSDDIKQLKKRIKELEAEIKTGTARLTRLSDKLANRLMDHLETLEQQKEVAESELAGLQIKTQKNGGGYALVDKVLDNLQEYLRHISTGAADSAVINRVLKDAGITIEAKPVSRKSRKRDRRGEICIWHTVQHGQPNRYTMHIRPIHIKRPPLKRVIFYW